VPFVLLALDVALVLSGSALAIAFVWLAARAASLKAYRAMAATASGAALAGAIAVYGAGCEAMDRVVERALSSLRAEPAELTPERR
jgi:hypothetical protein